MDLIPIDLKDRPDLAKTNAVFISNQLARDPSRKIHVVIKNKIIKAGFLNEIQKGNIGMSKNYRQFLQVDLVNPIKVTPYQQPTDKIVELSYLKIEVSTRKKPAKPIEIDETKIIQQLKKRQLNIYFNPGQIFYLEYMDVLYTLKVQQCFLMNYGIQDKSKLKSEPGRLTEQTDVDMIPAQNSGLLFASGNQKSTNLFRPDFKLQDMGIGGLDQELFNIFRRSFASRRFSPAVVRKFGVKHVKGILLYGPPGTGKTLIARQLAKALGAKNLEIVNGPEIFSRYVGQSEKNVRNLFSKARQDQEKMGQNSPLHVIVFDQIDAICKQRGMHSGGGSQVTDQVVNQLLTNIDGVNSLNNILVIGMTNRKDLLDDAILRPGRLEVHIEVKLPNLQGRKQIIQIHTKSLRNNKLLDRSFDLDTLAKLTKNYTGAEIEALVKCASSHSISRTTNIMDFSKQLIIDENKLSVSMDDFYQALEEVKPQFGTDQDKFNVYFRDNIINYGENYQKIMSNLMQTTLMPDIGLSQLRSVLLHGKTGTGKTTIALSFAKHCTFPFMKIISPQNYVSYTDNQKIASFYKIFEDAYKTTNACIIIDNIQRLINFTPIGRRFTNSVLQALLVLISKVPTKENCKLLIIATTSNYYHLDQLELLSPFGIRINVPALKASEISTILMQKLKLNNSEAQAIGKVMQGCTIGNLFDVKEFVENKNDPNQWKYVWENIVRIPDNEDAQ